MAHHKMNEGQSLWGDFQDYAPITLLVGPLLFIPPLIPGLEGTIELGIGWFVGAWVWTFLVALAHNLSHTGKWPLAFHTLHHERPMGDYGVTTPLWDWIFGTFTRGGENNHS